MRIRLALAVLYFARSVFAPAALSLFAVAVVWPVQKWLEERLPQLIALAITLLLTVFILSALLVLSVWGIGQVGRWMVANAAHLGHGRAFRVHPNRSLNRTRSVCGPMPTVRLASTFVR
jgi:predicted PurR-regulated permease PerM